MEKFTGAKGNGAAAASAGGGLFGMGGIPQMVKKFEDALASGQQSAAETAMVQHQLLAEMQAINAKLERLIACLSPNQ